LCPPRRIGKRLSGGQFNIPDHLSWTNGPRPQLGVHFFSHAPENFSARVPASRSRPHARDAEPDVLKTAVPRQHSGCPWPRRCSTLQGKVAPRLTALAQPPSGKRSELARAAMSRSFVIHSPFRGAPPLQPHLAGSDLLRSFCSAVPLKPLDEPAISLRSRQPSRGARRTSSSFCGVGRGLLTGSPKTV